MASLVNVVNTSESNQCENTEQEHDFTVKTWKEDFCLVVKGKRFYVAKNILALASPVFERMFQSDFKEKDQNELELPGKLSADVDEFLKCMYPGVMKEVTMKNVYRIIALAEEYQILDLKSRCEACFLSAVNETYSAEDTFKMINLASIYSLNQVIEKCTTLAANRSLSELDEANRKYSIPLKDNLAIHRKIIDGMKTKQEEKDKKLNVLLTLYKYHHAGYESSKRIDLKDLDAFPDWEGKSISKKIERRKIDSSNSDPVEVCVKFRETLFNLSFDRIGNDFVMTIDMHQTLPPHVNVRLVGNVVLINYMTGKKNFCKTLKLRFDQYTGDFNFDLLSIQELKGEGYIHDDAICVECNFLVSKYTVDSK